ncbi:YetF domain-containing protein [Pedobacter sp. JCM 36344]|uniref:YetF domain-containing protein n=1 Tax=Pedobacter sp. JCM 36344 TaxID=3374280 RepID=UPI00397B9C04
MLSIDWTRLLIGEENLKFLLEISFRTIIMYFTILIGVRLLSKRGMIQHSIFEFAVIISIGPAAGDLMFYKEIGPLTPIVIFAVIVEVKGVYSVEAEEFNIEGFKKENFAADEFISELGQQSIYHLGEIDKAILNTSGNVERLPHTTDTHYHKCNCKMWVRAINNYPIN